MSTFRYTKIASLSKYHKFAMLIYTGNSQMECYQRNRDAKLYIVVQSLK